MSVSKHIPLSQIQKNMTRQIAILGSTGSIGKNALRVIASLGPEFQVVALSAHSNVALLAEQAHQVHPKVICVTDESQVQTLVDRVRDLDVAILSGSKGLTEIAETPEVNTILSAVVGAAAGVALGGGDSSDRVAGGVIGGVVGGLAGNAMAPSVEKQFKKIVRKKVCEDLPARYGALPALK